MKTKIIFATALILSLLGKALAQDEKTKINWGVKAGYNLSTFKSDLENEKYNSGFHVGGVAELKISEKWSVQPELFYSLEGAKVSGRFTDGIIAYTMDNNIKLGYIQLPVMLKYYVVDKLTLEIGPQIGYLVTAKNKYDIRYDVEGDLNESGTQDVKEDFKKISLTLQAGFGYEFKNKLFLQARYHYGTPNINKSSGEEGDIAGDVTNQGFQFSLGYKF